ncbi:MAG: winged helix-turn-helix domain-containing protein [Nitrososphaerales archaeon]|nr:winged helix-turn-helix domain-containing protein [Nitrososphaerales archaeon]
MRTTAGNARDKILEAAKSPRRWTDLLRATDVTPKRLLELLNDLSDKGLIAKDSEGRYVLTERGREAPSRERKKTHFETVLELASKCDPIQIDVKKYLIHLYPGLSWVTSSYNAEVSRWRRTGQWKKLGESFAELSHQSDALVQLDNDLHQFLGEVFGPGWRYEIRYRKGTGWSPLAGSEREAERLSKEGMELPEYDPELKYTPAGVGNYPEDYLMEATLKGWNDSVNHALKMYDGAMGVVGGLEAPKGEPFKDALRFMEVKSTLERTCEILRECLGALAGKKETQKKEGRTIANQSRS